jgi:hypothetical protein
LGTLLHEFAHGLGFSSFIDPTTGASGLPAIFDFHVFDETKQSTWAAYPAAQRKPLLTAGNELSFDGASVAAGIPTHLGKAPAVTFSSGGSTSEADFLPGDFSGPVPDGGAQTVTPAAPLDACSTLPAGSLTGTVGLIERGTCTFYEKAQRAVAAGASGVIVFDNDAGSLLTMATPDGGTDLAVPAVFITNQDGNGVLQRLDGGTVSASFGFSSHTSNTDAAQSRVLLYTPSAVSGGSTLSHWNSGSFPHALLMEPFISVQPQLNLDLTPASLADLGWSVVDGLTVGMSKAQDPKLADGAQGTYLVAVLNRRPTPVSGVQLSLKLPAGATFVSTQGSCQAMPCDLGTLDAGAVLPVVVTVQAPSPTVFPFVVTAQLSASATDGSDNLSAVVSADKASSGGGCSAGGVPAALVLLLVAAAGFRARRV